MHSHVWYSIFAVFVVQSNKESVTGSVIDLGHGYISHASVCWEPDKRFEILDVEIKSGSNGLVYVKESFSTLRHALGRTIPFQSGWMEIDRYSTGTFGG